MGARFLPVSQELAFAGFVGIDCCGFDGIDRKYGKRQQFASAGDVLGALAGGEQAIVADAVKARIARDLRACSPST